MALPSGENEKSAIVYATQSSQFSVLIKCEREN